VEILSFFLFVGLILWGCIWVGMNMLRALNKINKKDDDS